MTAVSVVGVVMTDPATIAMGGAGCTVSGGRGGCDTGWPDRGSSRGAADSTACGFEFATSVCPADKAGDPVGVPRDSPAADPGTGPGAKLIATDIGPVPGTVPVTGPPFVGVTAGVDGAGGGIWFSPAPWFASGAIASPTGGPKPVVGVLGIWICVTRTASSVPVPKFTIVGLGAPAAGVGAGAITNAANA